FDLVEADQRKAAFLRDAIRATAATARVHAVRIEAARLAPAPLVTARAVAPLTRLLELAAPLLATGGVCGVAKGRSAGDELTQATGQWQMHVEAIPSLLDPDSTILKISEITRVGPE